MTQPLDTLSEFIAAIERAGELRRITHPVKVHLEMCEIADRVMKMPGGGPALLFEKPVLRDGTIASDETQAQFVARLGIHAPQL